MNNFETALRAEASRVARNFQHYDTNQMALLQSSQGHRTAIANRGEFFYTHPAVPDRAFPSRKAAARAAMEAV